VSSYGSDQPEEIDVRHSHGLTALLPAC